VDGIDFANTEASVFMESLIGRSARSPRRMEHAERVRAAGDDRFRRRTAGTRYVPGLGAVPLPGARAPGEPGYDPRIDGTTAVS